MGNGPRVARGNAVPAADRSAILAALRELVDTVRAHYARRESGSPVPTAALRLLAEIAAAPGSNPGVLAARLRLHRSSLSNLLRLLEDARLARRSHAISDHRRVEVSPTAAGRRLLTLAGARGGGPLAGAVARLDEAGAQAVERALPVLLDAVRASIANAPRKPAPRRKLSPSR